MTWGTIPYLTLLACLSIVMDKGRTDEGSSSDQGVLVHPVGSLHLLCEVRHSANDQVALSSHSTC